MGVFFDCNFVLNKSPSGIKLINKYKENSIRVFVVGGVHQFTVSSTV